MAWIKGVAPKLLHDKMGLYQGNWMPEMDRCWEDFDRGYRDNLISFFKKL